MFYIKKNGVLKRISGRIQSLVASAIGFTPPTGMSATDVQDAIGEIYSRVNANTRISVHDLTDGVEYICPTDGYVYLYLTSTDSGGFIDVKAGAYLVASIGRTQNSGAYFTTSFFVKKGLTVQATSLSGTGIIASFRGIG